MQIIWVMGASGVGKATFLARLVGSDGRALRERLGLTGSVAVRVPPIPRECRASIEREVMGANVDHLLLKWQFATHSSVLALYSRRTSDDHGVFLLTCEPELNQERLRGRTAKWAGSAEELAREAQRVLDHARELEAAGLTLRAFDTAAPEYPEVPVP